MKYKMDSDEDFQIVTKSGGTVTVPPSASDDNLVLKSYVDDLFGDLSYQKISISSFTVSPSTKERGTKVTSATLTCAFNKKAVSVTLDGSAQGSLANTTGGTISLTGLSLTSNKTWTLTATDAGSANNAPYTASKTVTLSFLNGIYYGVAAEPASIDSSFLLNSGFTKTLSSGRVTSFTKTAGTGEYIWYALPVSIGACAFKVGGFDGGFSLVSTFSFTNSEGFSENYYVYRSDNANLGSTTVTITAA